MIINKHNDKKAFFPSIASTSGQALVEFILIFLIFISFVFITLQFTLITNAKSILNVAAYAACRSASHSDKGAPLKDILNPIWGDLEPTAGFSNTHYNISHNPQRHNAKFGDKFKSTVTIHYKLMPIPLMKKFFTLAPSKKSIVLTASCTSFKEG